ncbi:MULTISPECIES: TetR/AcrR family transcriptional regulator [Ruegeria]|uniref:TetR/AcrR family transcriptional regulator n=1 Tax=Ruegeria TaxID=97050 RepID=UPI001480AE3F|nr:MULTISPECIES: TetR/AcrR family transcriptional regulator [Ruegeria]UUV06337.1 TetR/AcrR family transcriptional regulator [Ruegeria sp. YS9]
MPKIVDREEMQGRILDAAMACFLDQGYHATKMQDVARQSGLAKGTLYLYFQSKEVLLLALLQRYFDDIRARIRMIPSPQTLDQFMMGLRLTMPADRLAATRLFFDVLGPGFQDPRAAEIIGGFFAWLADHYAAQFEPLIESEEIRDDLSAQSAAQAVTAMLDGLVIHLAIFGVDKDVFETRRDAALSLLEVGLRG